jgi:lysophospholipase L1-like esterase
VSFGDSVASGFRLPQMIGRIKGGTYADKLGASLHQRTGKSVRVKNLTRAGYKIWKIHKLMTDIYPEEIRKADVLLLQGGGVDFILDIDRSDDPERQEEVAQNVIAYSKAIMNVALKNSKVGTKVVFVGPHFPKEKMKRASTEKHLKSTIAQLKRLSRQRRIPYVDTQKILCEATHDVLQMDRVHPNNAGNEALKNEILRVISF